MKHESVHWLLLAAALGLAAAAPAQEAAAEAEAPAAEMEVETPADRISRLAQPAEHHEHLARLAGDWDLTIRVWTTPDGEPLESTGTASARTILGGRFLETAFVAELLGRPFEGRAVDGYDNAAEEYVGTWRDTQGTYTLVYRGDCSEDGTVRTMEAKLTDPLSEEKLQLRTVVTLEDDDHFIQESFIVLSEDEALKNLEIRGRRRGSG